MDPCYENFAHMSVFSDRLKDGMVAAEQCSRYHMDGNSLVIRDVAEEDAGKYTVLVRILEHGLYQNLTLTLMVNGENHWFKFSTHQPPLALSILPSAIKLCSCLCGCLCGLLV